MEVKPGYKQTEVGVIPEDWDVAKLSVFADVKTGPFGSALHERDYVDDGTPIITVEHLGERGIIHKNLPHVSDLDRNRLRVYSLQPGDIVFSRVGSIDRNALISNAEDGWLFSGRLLRIRVFNRDVHSPYLSYCFHSELFRSRVRAVAVGQTMASLNTQILKGLLIVLPPSPEQCAIAEALSDVDLQLGVLDRLIAKKRDLKQAAMKQLLTGQTRLKGFGPTKSFKQYDYGIIPDDWSVRPFNNVSSMNGRIGWQGLKQDEFSENPDDPFLITGMNFRDGRIRWGEVYHIPTKRYQEAPNIQLQVGDVLVTKDGTIGKLLFVDHIPYPGKASLNSHLLVFRPLNQQYNPKFLFYQLGSPAFARHIELHKSGSTFFGLTQAATGKYPVVLPPLPEQTSIAAALSDMDGELTVLEARRDKTRDLKQAMMQELLTGKMRLVPAGAAHA